MRSRGVYLDGERIVELFKRRGWSQQDLANRAGLDSRTIAKVRRGGACDASTLQLLALALSVPPEELLVRNVPQPQPSEPHPEALNGSSSATIESRDSSWTQPFRIAQVWKTIDLRKPYACGDQASGFLWEWMRAYKLEEGNTPMVLSYLTWGDGIECLGKPEGTEWRQVPVEPGDLAHSEKQWELSIPPPPGPAGTLFDCGPFHLRFINAFHGSGQQWWQTHITYEIQSLVIQLLFSEENPCKSIVGTCAMPGLRKFISMKENEPFRLHDGSVANWHIQRPPIGAFFKLAWEW